MGKRKKRSTQPQTIQRPEQAALERFLPLLGAGQLALLQAELARPLHPGLRANPLKCDPQPALDDWAQAYGWQVEPVPFCAEGRRVISAQTSIAQTIEHRLGFYYIQDAASMLPVELFDFTELEQPLILDLAASPGGKTTHLVSKTFDQGLVIANDASASRLTALRLVLQTWGAVGAAVTRFPGEKFGLWFPETFDRALLDAPCSMQGLRSTEGHKMRPVSQRETGELARRQKALLESALRAVKVGGQVVYSTCTLSPEEDEAVLDALLCRHPGTFTVDDVSSRLPAPAPALAELDGQPLAGGVEHALRLWPHTLGTAGFFAARLTKTAPLPVVAQTPPERSFSRSGLEPLSRREQAGLVQQLAESYGLEETQITANGQWEIWRRGEAYHLLPTQFLSRFPDFPCEELGLLLAERTPDGLSPSHDWAGRLGPQMQTGTYTLDETQAASWLRGEDVPGGPASGLPAGSVVVVFDGQRRLLGRGKILAGKIKNLLPRRII